MSATRADILRAKRVVRLVNQRGAIRDTELAANLGATWEQTRTAIGIAVKWGKVDRCGEFIVASAPSSSEGGDAA